jgi:hypothetical protein
VLTVATIALFVTLAAKSERRAEQHVRVIGERRLEDPRPVKIAICCFSES